MAGSSGWISTKKRGRDDVAIARDQTAAVKQRKKQTQRKPHPPPNLTVPTKKKPRKSVLAWDNDAEYEDDGFVVADDEIKIDDDDDELDDEIDVHDDDDSSEEEFNLKRRQPASKTNKKKKPSFISLVDDDDSEDDDADIEIPTKRASKKQDKSRYFAKTSHHALEDSDDESGEDRRKHLKKKKKSKKKTKQTKSILSSSDDDDDFWSNNRPQQQKSTQQHVYKQNNSKNAYNDNSNNKQHDDFAEDSDEAVALVCALEENALENTRNDNEDKVVQALLLEDSESDNDNDNNNDDENDDVYEDPQAKEAGTILQAANELSAQVLTTMTQWASHNTSNGDNNSNNGSTPLGMITSNGALTLSHVDIDNSNATKSASWITNATMKTIMPEGVTLADYQLIGVNWMALLHSMQCRVGSNTVTSKSKQQNQYQTHNVNGVLADEMGLGKTIQTIAFLSWLKHSRTTVDLVDDASDVGEQVTEFGPHLVVAPSSVLSNWEREFTKFAPHLNVVKYHGSMQERLAIREETLKVHLPANAKVRRRHNVAKLDVILTPITYFQTERSDDRSFLRKFRYEYMVVDEAHVLKNAKGRRYKSLDSFSTEHRLLLTGTPVQNSPKELMCLLCFLMPLFSKKGGGAHSFDEQGNDGGEGMLQHFVSMERNCKDTDDATAYQKLKQLFAPFVLRRRKVDVLGQLIPPKTRRVEHVELDPQARRLYDSMLAAHIASRKGGTAALSREHLFTQLRKCAHHPLLLRSRHLAPEAKSHLAKWFYQYGAFRGEACTLDKVREELEGFNDFDIHLTALELIAENELRREEVGRYVLKADDLFSSAKCVRLRTLLPKLIADGHRILIFSVWTTCLDLLSCLLEQLGLDYLRMEGSTAVNERQALIDRFTEETQIPVFLLSTKACGLGINLTCADTCIMHDLDFNPFNDLQAEDRCHRIGQTKPVTIIKMVTQDTVDEDIYNMQQRKARMNAAIMDNPTGAANEKTLAKEKKQVLHQAVNRYLQSPSLKGGGSARDKENTGNDHETTRL